MPESLNEPFTETIMNAIMSILNISSDVATNTFWKIISDASCDRPDMEIATSGTEIGASAKNELCVKPDLAITTMELYIPWIKIGIKIELVLKNAYSIIIPDRKIPSNAEYWKSNDTAKNDAPKTPTKPIGT